MLQKYKGPLDMVNDSDGPGTIFTVRLPGGQVAQAGLSIQRLFSNS
jgi:hypothetical protein